jgi:predicted GIY-YIG superfamily endonuclease
MKLGWVVYVLVSRRGRTYVGVTDDLRRRLAAHNGTRPGGAKATRAGRPWRIGAIYGPVPTRGAAQRLEHALKRLKGRRRLTVAATRLAIAALRGG